MLKGNFVVWPMLDTHRRHTQRHQPRASCCRRLLFEIMSCVCWSFCADRNRRFGSYLSSAFARAQRLSTNVRSMLRSPRLMVRVSRDAYKEAPLGIRHHASIASVDAAEGSARLCLDTAVERHRTAERLVT